MLTYAHIRRIVSLFALILCVGTLARVQPSHAQTAIPPKTLRVGLVQIAPFATKTADGYRGISIDLWEEMAKRLDLKYEYVEPDSINQLLDLLKTGQIDLTIPGLGMTSTREAGMDFTYSVLDGGLKIMTSGGTGPSLGDYLSAIFSSQMDLTLLIVLIVIVISSHVVWYIQRKKNPEFPQRYFRGVIEGLWYVTTRLIDPGNSAETEGHLGRLLSVVWIFVGIIVIAQFTGAVTSAITLNELRSSIQGVNDLYNKRVATVDQTIAVKVLADLDIPPVLVPKIDDAYRLLLDGKVDAVVFEGLILQYFAAHQGRGHVTLAPDPIRPVSYSIALPTNSPLRESLDLTLLQMKEDGVYDSIYQKWFGQ